MNTLIAEQAEQEAETTLRWLHDERGRYHFAGRKHFCIFCGEKHKLSTGYLPVVGAIWKCPDCSDRYHRLRRILHETIA
jgi:hypothetical protein